MLKNIPAIISSELLKAINKQLPIDASVEKCRATGKSERCANLILRKATI